MKIVKKVVNVVFFVMFVFVLFGCQKETKIQVICNDKSIEYLTEKQEKVDLGSLMDSRIKVEHGDIVRINIDNSNVKITEFILNEDGTQRYQKGQPIELLDDKEASFEIMCSFSDFLSSNQSDMEPDAPSLRGYVVEYEDKVITFVIETNVGDLTAESDGNK